MATRAVAGDFLREATGHLQAAALSQEPLCRAADIAATCQSLGRVAAVLARYLDDVAPFAGATDSGAALINGWPRAALQAGESLRNAARNLGYSGSLAARPRDAANTETAVALNGASVSLTAARDLLHSHLTPRERGGPYVSEWAQVILSAQVRRALSAEVCWCAGQAARVAACLAQPGRQDSRSLVEARARLASAGYSLWAGGESLQVADFREPVRRADLELLHAVPARTLPARVVPGQAGRVPELCAGVTSTAERVRQATWLPQPGWSPAISTASLRYAARVAVVISHNCGIALEALAARAGDLGRPEVAAALARSAQAAFTTRSEWFSVARWWSGQVVTDVSASREPVSAEAGDLAHWTGRLVYADPQWTPAHGRSASMRPLGELAPDLAGVVAVAAAVHQASDTLQRLAESGRAQVRAVASAGRLYVPTRSLPPEYDIPRRYGPCPPGRTESLVGAYAAAEYAAAALAGSLDAMALATEGPSRILALSRAASGRSPAHPADQPAQLAAAPAVGMGGGPAEEELMCGQPPVTGIGF